MRATRLAAAAAFLWFAATPMARADDGTPVPQPTSPPVVVAPPTAPPVVDVPTSAPVPVDTPQPDQAPVPVSRESHPITHVNEPVTAPPTVSSTTDNPQPPPAASQRTTSSLGVPRSRSGSAHPGSPGAPGTSSVASGVTLNPSTPPGAPSDLSPDQSSTSGPSIVDVNAAPTGAAAPAQLACHGRDKGVADPFLVAPYSGWTEINSFVDHDNPDYRQDGTIILANGLTATAADGQASDFFPSYWSPALRQYVSYDGHNGYDFGISYQPVLAAGDGTVTFADWNGSSESEGYGQMILIDHHNGYVTLYGHLSKLEVKAGDKVLAGQEIGISGSTGNSSGPHLHFSVFHNCQVTDPYGWTGHGDDPLQGFDGEQSAYLWLPGHDPLVLNPPPHWPAFPLGLKVPLPGHAGRLLHLGRRIVPPVDRLLLLKLPLPHPGQPVAPGVALARTEAAITQEGEALSPYLRDLQSQNVLESYVIVPAAAAVWVRGTASAEQLEGLPGVASLAGVRPRDLVAAQAGLSHSVLIQIGPRQAPSLWPVGFRSALDTWRPLTTVTANDALLTGLALPGQQVMISLHRGSSVPGAAEVVGDAETGGFVALLHDRAGNPVATQPGDRVEISAGGKTERIDIARCAIAARSSRIVGATPPGSTVSVTVAGPDGNVLWKTVTTASANGSFHIRPRTRLAAGDLAVAAVVGSGGDGESAAAFVPGVEIEEDSATIRGWTVGNAPRLRILRNGRLLVSKRLHPSTNGEFQIELQSHRQPISIQRGDVVSIGSRWHQHMFTVPDLRVRLPLFATRVAVSGPAGSRLHATLLGADGAEWARGVTLGPSGIGHLHWPGGMIGTGDAAAVEYVTASGDRVLDADQVRGFIVREGDSAIRGRVRPGTTLGIRVFTPAGTLVASTVATGDPTTGTFTARLHDAAGRPVALDGAVRLVVREGDSTLTFNAPALVLALQRRTGTVTGWTLPHTEVHFTTVDMIRGERVTRAVTDANGRVLAHLPRRAIERGNALVTLATSVADSLTVERSIAIAPPAATGYPVRVARPPANHRSRAPRRAAASGAARQVQSPSSPKSKS